MFTPKTVLVTGASRGIGLALVKGFLGSPGVTVLAACRNPDNAKELKSLVSEHGNRLHLVQLDVTNDNNIAEAVKTTRALSGESLELLVNNAGILNPPKASSPEDEHQKLLEHFDTNSVAPLLLSRAFLPLMTKGDGVCSVILNISSSLASMGKFAGVKMCGFGYPMSKAALNFVTKALGEELKPQGVVVVSMCPGWVKTDMGSQAAMLQPEESVGAILTTVASLRPEHTGTFLDRLGNAIPW